MQGIMFHASLLLFLPPPTLPKGEQAEHSAPFSLSVRAVVFQM